MAKIQCILKLPPSNQKGMCYEANMYRDIQIQVPGFFLSINPIPAMDVNGYHLQKVQAQHLFDGIAAKFMHKVGHESALEQSSHQRF